MLDPQSITPEVVARYWPKVDQSAGPDACWPWLARRDRKGYGQFKVGGQTCRATHVALVLDGRPVPPGLLACHSCDQPPCMNPAHLWIGTYADNAADSIAKGRWPSRPGSGDWLRLHPEARPRGERHHSAKLTEARVVEIRQRYALDHSHGILRQLSREYGVAHPTILAIVNRRTWKHLP